MPIYRNNNTRLPSLAFTDEDGNPITTGTVNVAVLSRDRGTEYFSNAAATHDAGGVWYRDISGVDVQANIPAAVARAWVRFQIGDPVVAEFWRLEAVKFRESTT